MSRIYYQLSRVTGTYIRKQEDAKPKKNGTILKHMKSRGTRATTEASKETKFVGVSFCSRTLKWRAYISVNGVLKALGSYDTDVLAAKAYDRQAIQVGRNTNLLKRA